MKIGSFINKIPGLSILKDLAKTINSKVKISFVDKTNPILNELRQHSPYDTGK